MFNKDKNNKKSHENDAGIEEHAEDKSVKDTGKPSGNEKEMVCVEKEEFERLKSEAQKSRENWDRYVRQQADFDNMRKRLERDKIEFVKYANEEIIFELLGILDDLERSVGAAEKGQENFEAFLKGVEMILAHLYDLFKKRGVTPIADKGKKFDPNEQEALMQTETNEHDDGIIIEELQKGYKLNDRVIRTAKVRVAKKTEDKK